ncbi:MAG: hypothetical protein IT443_06780 [Phycisphaeraceae bacterium]|nr:hypothetical protein [Phycisphaeraceae bacterium]
MRLICIGSGEFGLPTFARLRDKHEIAAVISQPDKPAGRGRQPTPTPVAQWAQAAGLPLIKAPNVNDPAIVDQVRHFRGQGDFRGHFRGNAAVVIAFGQKLGPALLEALGPLSINLHASLLPRYRGAAPINWAILRGETVTGISVIALAERMDAGLIYEQVSTPIDPRETAGELHDRLAHLGPQAILDVLDRFADASLTGQPQDESHATQAPKLSKAHSTLQFDVPAEEFRRHVHGLTPWPGADATWHHQSDRGLVTMPLRILRVEPMENWPVPPDAKPGMLYSDPQSPGSLIVVTGKHTSPTAVKDTATGTSPERLPSSGMHSPAGDSASGGGSASGGYSPAWKCGAGLDITEAASGGGCTSRGGELTGVRILELHPAGKKAMKAEDFVRGHTIKHGDYLA